MPIQDDPLAKYRVSKTDDPLAKYKGDSNVDEPGNIDLKAQPKVKNPNGGISTVYSKSYNLDGKEVLLPSVTPDGRFLSTDDEVLNEYKTTGRHLGKFSSVDKANKYAEQLHKDYESGLYDDKKPEEKGILSSIGDWLTTPFLPEAHGAKLENYDNPLASIARGATEIGAEGYNQLIRPMSSPVGAAITAASGPLLKAGIKGASMLPGASKVASLLTSKIGEAEAPSFIKGIVNSLTPKDSEGVKLADELLAAKNTNSDVIEQQASITPVDKLLEAVKSSKPLEEKQASIYSKERGKRIGEAEKVTTPGQKGFFERKGQLAGEHTKVQMEPLKLEQPDVDELYNNIHTSPLEPFQRIHAGDGLTKILSGQVPQDSQIQLLSKVFGEDKISELSSHLPTIKQGDILHELTNVPRAMQTIWDLSMPLRQGKGLIMSRDWWKAWPDMVKSFGSENTYKGIMDSIMERPNFVTKTLADGTREEPLFRRAGVHITDLTDLSSREESMMAPMVEQVVPGARASNRAATAFINKLRADHFDRLVSGAEAAGLKPLENEDLLHQIGSFINNATGRGSLGPAEKYAVGLNDVMFSPRFLASRVNMLNPANYLKLNTPEGRMVSKQYWKSAAGLTGAWMAKLKAEEYAGAKVNWDDPSSSDFLKAKWDNTTDDPGAGFQQIMVLLSRLAQESYKTAAGKDKDYGRGFGTKTMKDAIEEFVANKLAPVPKFFYDSANASEYRPFDANDRTIRLVVPMIMQDLSELSQEDSSLLPLLGGAFLGESVMVNNPKQSKMFGDTIPSANIPSDSGNLMKVRKGR